MKNFLLCCIIGLISCTNGGVAKDFKKANTGKNNNEGGCWEVTVFVNKGDTIYSYLDRCSHNQFLSKDDFTKFLNIKMDSSIKK